MRVSRKTGAPAPPTTVGVSSSLQSEPVPTAPVALFPAKVPPGRSELPFTDELRLPVTVSLRAISSSPLRIPFEPQRTVRRQKVERVRRRCAELPEDAKTELLVAASVNYRDCQACDRQAPMLVDLGSMCFAIAPRSCFPEGTLVPATRPLRIFAVNGTRLEGGTQGAVVDLGIAMEGCDGSAVEMVCEGWFVYMAEVQEQRIVG